MNPEAALGLGQQTLWIAAQIAAPMVLAGLIVGVLMSILQAATQIQDQSLVFVPKVLALMAVLALCGGWMMVRVTDFTRELILALPHYAR